MYGITFKKNTSNDILCAGADFSVQKRNDQGHYVAEHYRFGLHPDRCWITQRDENHDYQEIQRGTPAETKAHLVTLLPDAETSDGLQWDWSSFWTALTFFGEGYKLGYDDGTRLA